MEYTTVFDVTESGYRQWWFASSGLIFVAIGMGLILIRRRLRGVMHRYFPFVMLGFAVLWTVVAFVFTARDYTRLASALREGRCEVAEGAVTHFDGGPKRDSFVVAGRRFEYNGYEVIAGFNRIAADGGPIRQDVRVRIHHLGDDIAKLEIAR